MKKLFTLFALALALIGGNAQAQNYPLPEVVRYGASYKSLTLMAANTPDTVFTPAANTKGAIVWTGSFINYNAAGQGCVFIAKTSAPATMVDGDVIMSANTFSYGGISYGGSMARAVFIPAGKGLYYICLNAEGLSFRHALYTLLQ